MGEADELQIERRPELERPVFICSFRGWNDGGQGASLAGSFLARRWRAEQFATIDPERFFDFQMTRPHVAIVGGDRQIDWPENSFQYTRIAGPDGGKAKDAVLLLGTEPSLRWRAFTQLVSGLASELGASLVVTLGSLLADVPHTRPSPVTASASDATVLQDLGLQPSRYEGPTGVVGVLHDAMQQAGIPSVSLWAAVPHYVSLTPSPRAAKALCDRLAGVLEVPIDTEELEEASTAYIQQVSEAVAADEETAAYVDELESRAEEIEEEGDLPSGDTLAAELTRFLREREQDGGDGPSSARGEQ
jgi:predicted ATP-grasp superfamily ATP-dependent carboligase